MVNIEEQKIDNKLLISIKKGDESAKEILLTRYRQISIYKANSFCKKYDIPPSYHDDYRSIFFVCVLLAIEKFDFEQDNFYSFYSTFSYFEALNYLKGMVKPVILEDDVLDANNYVLMDSGSEEEDYRVEIIEKAMKKDKTVMKKEEKTIIKYYLDGYDSEEIRLMLNINLQKFYRLRRNAIKKLHTLIIKNK